MSTGPCHFPVEVLELFVDRIADFPDDFERRCNLQKCSLSSHALRNRAQHYLFSSVQFMQPSYTISSKLHSRLRTFRDIATSGLQFPMTTLLFHVQSFALVLNGSVFDAYTMLKNDDLTEIMRLLVIHSKVIHTTVMLGSSMRIFWPYLDLHFRKAFKELCQVPSMTTLHLNNICSVPATFLKDTTIRDIRLHLVTLFNPISGGPRFNFLWNVSQLHSIDIDHTFPFPNTTIIESDSRNRAPLKQYRSSFSNIRRLKYTFYEPDDFQKFTDIALSIPSLEEACMVFSPTDSSGVVGTLRGRVPFVDLPALRKLAIHHKSSIATGFTNSLFKVLETLKFISIPPALENIELGFEVHTHPPWLEQIEFFPEARIWSMLDKALANEKFDLIKTVDLKLHYSTLQAQPWTFDEKFFHERCRNSMTKVFPLLVASESKELDAEISVQVLPLMDS